ncbi:MAG: GNAT family N-acetyltransferase, partial [Archaeoglobi archaeon]|nr:GNAT family N-acetyltransferase [Candidatus Mnemosynella sp.]
HIYGPLVPFGRRGTENVCQHRGFGERLLRRAEEISKEEGFDRIAVISGIGVREYYRKRGYELEGPYMVKEL